MAAFYFRIEAIKLNLSHLGMGVARKSENVNKELYSGEVSDVPCIQSYQGGKQTKREKKIHKQAHIYGTGNDSVRNHSEQANCSAFIRSNMFLMLFSFAFLFFSDCFFCYLFRSFHSFFFKLFFSPFCRFFGWFLFRFSSVCLFNLRRANWKRLAKRAESKMGKIIRDITSSLNKLSWFNFIPSEWFTRMASQ